MLRHWCVALGAAWLGTMSLQAPFAHVHPNDPEHHHATGFAHTHLALERHHDASVEAHGEDDELAVGLEWVPVAKQRVVIPRAAAAASSVLDPRHLSAGAAPEFTPRSHDPPLLRLRPSRAPPL
jgi:hypothetical protein